MEPPVREAVEPPAWEAVEPLVREAVEEPVRGAVELPARGKVVTGSFPASGGRLTATGSGAGPPALAEDVPAGTVEGAPVGGVLRAPRKRDVSQ